MQELDKIVTEAKHAFQAARTLAELDQTKGQFLGKQGVLTDLRKGLGKVSAEERPILGAKFNNLKTRINLLAGPLPLPPFPLCHFAQIRSS